MERMIVEKEWLVKKMGNEDVSIVDCRFDLNDKAYGKQQYDQGHLPNAIYFHLEEDLSGEVKKHGGRHPLPDLEQFKIKLEKAGISNDRTVIAYDRGEGAFAARFLWMMKYVGHEKVMILNGGYSKWEEAGYPIESDIPSVSKSTYTIHVQEKMLATYDLVKNFTLTKPEQTVLIDSREYKRYAGLEELIDRVPGHIPGAINEPFMAGFKDGYFLSKEEQDLRFNHLDRDKTLIVYCGSGVTASPNYIALKEAGFENVKLYVGSYSDWISYEDNPVEKIEALNRNE